jgi:hypothetical protein
MNGLTRNQARVAIMQDVLVQLTEGELTAREGVYLNRSTQFAVEVSRAGPERDLPECSACAIGSMFICAVRLFDDFVRVGNGTVFSGTMIRRLRPYFADRELREIERTFEAWGQGFNSDLCVPDLWDMAPVERLTMIATHIVANDGEWRPHEL